LNTAHHDRMDNLAQGLAGRVEVLRALKGISKAQLAREVGVTRQMVHNWYAGRTWPKPREMLALAAALETSVSHLYGETPDPRPAPRWEDGEGPAGLEAAKLLREALARLEGQEPGQNSG